MERDRQAAGTQVEAGLFLPRRVFRNDQRNALARRLLATAAGFGLRSNFSPTVQVRQELLARSLGLVRATVTPILQDWRRRGIVDSSYGRITLIDVEQMKAVAGYADWPEFYRSAFNLPGTSRT